MEMKIANGQREWLDGRGACSTKTHLSPTPPMELLTTRLICQKKSLGEGRFESRTRDFHANFAKVTLQ